MSENCLSKNPLLRDGTSQQQRLLKTLLPSYVAVDERSLKDLTRFAYKLASEINYYEYHAETDILSKSNWEDFFAVEGIDGESFSFDAYLKKLKKTSETEPHMALFIAFLHLFEVAQNDLNTITQRHLDFYYREVLQLKENPAVADQVAVIFQLAKNTNAHLLKKGTRLKAGKDDAGIERIYALEKDIVVNKAVVADLKAVYANINNSFSDLTPNPQNDHRIYISPTANSADGRGADIEPDEKSWNTFGEPVFTDVVIDSVTTKQADRAQAEIGFAIASPILFLAEGKRKITVHFTFPSDISLALSNDTFTMKLSGEKEWILPENSATDVTKTLGKKLIVSRTLSEDQEAVVAFNQENLDLPFGTKWPVLSIVLNTEKAQNPFLYKTLKNLKPKKVKISVDVSRVKNLVLQNDEALLDPSKPFLPFGSRPFIGSNFYIGSWEVFQKKLDSLSISLKWNDLPSGSFDSYYAVYEDSNSRKNSAFKLDIKCLDKKNWVSINNTSALFTNSSGNAITNGSALPDADSTSLIKTSASIKNIARDEKLADIEQFDHNKTKGFLRLTLKGKNFGHKVFPNVYAKQAIAMAGEIDKTFDMANLMADFREDISIPGHGPKVDASKFSMYKGASLPNPPYTPSVQDLSLEYTSSVEYKLEKVSEPEFKKRVEKCYFVDAFGVMEVDASRFTNPLLPQYDNEGNLYIGIKNLVPPQTLSLLFQLAEGSANPDKPTQKLQWHFLKNNEWVAFDKSNILSDSTRGLLTSGIVSLAVPKEACSDNTLLPAGVHWIRVAVQKDSDAICKLIDVRCQAVLAQFKDKGNDPDHLRLALAADSIGKLEKSDNAIKEITQPYASFNGKVAEESADFYTRISERLRHKQRGITIWDYEHLVLQNFPAVYKVKCANHTRFEGTLTNYSEVAPGHLTLIVVSNVQNKNAVDPLRPKTSLATLDAISVFITGLNPMAATVHVKNPIYEEVKVKFKVKFLKDDLGYYETQLAAEIKAFLSPWSSGCASDIAFGGRIHKSVILNFVEERAYVDYVSCFEMFHIVPLDPANNPNLDVEEAIATTAISILGSADSHIVNAIPVGSDDCLCDTNEIISTDKMIAKNDCPCNE